ncbi:MAG: sel1 repeat family protein [Neisseriaceae bacterium]|nr:sel1 repeat family protein [Neisseriaceae bacterium]
MHKNNLVTLTLMLSSLVWAGDSKNAITDYRAKDYAEVKTAAENGNADAQYELASRHLYAYGGGTENKSMGWLWMTQAAEQGNVFAQMALGRLYLAYTDVTTAKGVEENNAEAVRWFSKAADQGNIQAIQMLGWINEWLENKDSRGNKIQLPQN